MIIEFETCPKCGLTNAFGFKESRMAEDFRVRSGGSRVVHIYSEEVCFLCDVTSPVAAEDDLGLDDTLPF